VRKYPIGQQDFRGIIEDGYLYVDKTRLIYTLIDSGKYYFLSRPRRFGKSLLLSTIEEIFKGSKELFKGLWIENHWNWEKRHPVIHIGISSIDYQRSGLYDALSQEMNKIAERFNLTLTSLTLKNKFIELIENLAKEENVVILIDEYDKPIIDYLDDPERAEANRLVFKEFYSVLKDAGKYIRLLLITGVSRFSKVSIFSDLNNLDDISLAESMNDLLGITQEELENNFNDELNTLPLKFEIDKASLIEEIKKWYNGYSWMGKNTLYNPFSLLSFMKHREFKNYWFQTGTPSFLINEVRRNPRFSFSENEYKAREDGLQDLYNIHKDGQHVDPVTLMFQTGYLTIKYFEPKYRLYTLGYPNQKVKESVLTWLVSAYSFQNLRQVGPTISELSMAFAKNDISKVMQIVDTLFAMIPYQLWTGAKESFFHGLLQNTFQLLGVNPESEVSSANGRADLTIKTITHIYIMEFKLDGSTAEALNQIIDKGYLRPYRSDLRQKTIIGINFSSAKRQVENYEIKEM
jgi:hypothetical protein